ncbi:TolC family protein [Sulfurimonas sp.]|uniref:TolC family protein n=1 Tax=Sulfurimonas sp. TaxID=2022749 RepID=UPI0025F25910|nr:TolC family protein [Sulfurimonas sp.]MDD5156861.1 TolC family protein [Sulfurimonas sp.]
MAQYLKIWLLVVFLISKTLADSDPFSVLEGQNPNGCSVLDLSQPIKLADAVAQALCANPQTHVAWANVRYQSALVGTSNTNYYPTLTANIATSENHDSGKSVGSPNYSKLNGNVVFNYLLYDFGNRDALHNQATSAMLSSKNSYESAVQSVFFTTVQSYYNLFAAQASLEAYISAENAAKESLDAVQTKVKAGIAVPADRLQARASYAQSILTRVGAEGTLALAKGNFAAALGLDAQTSLAVLPPQNSKNSPIPENRLNDLVSKAKEMRPDLVAARSDIKTADAAIIAAKTSAMPTISLASSVNAMDTSASTSTTSSNIGVNLSFPIFTGYATTYKIAEAKEQKGIKEALAKSLEKQVTLDVYTAYTNLLTASNQEALTDDLVVSASASYDVSLGRYRAGVGTILDVVSSQALLSSAKQQKVTTLYLLAIARIALARALGDKELMNNELNKEVGQ